MIVEIDLRGRRRAVDVRRDGERWIVVVDGRALSASVTQTGEHWSLLVGPAEAGHHGPENHGQENVASGFGRTSRSHEISIERGKGGEHIVHVDGHAVPVAIVDPLRQRRHGTARADLAAADGRTRVGSADGHTVVAPMPGRIVRVLVRPGDVVEARQGLVVVEAMKMENELRASRPGRVTEVRVAEGMSVEANAVLVLIDDVVL